MALPCVYPFGYGSGRTDIHPYLLVDAEVPLRAAEWVQAHIESQRVFLLALNFFLLIVGYLMDIFSAIVVVVPLITPIGNEFLLLVLG